MNAPTPASPRPTLFPAIDLLGGRVVRLRQGRAEEATVYFPDALEPARRWRAAGAEWVHVVDLDGAFQGRPGNLEVIPGIVATGLRVQWGGGLRRAEDVARVLAQGVERVVLGTKAARDREFLRGLLAEHGARLAVGIDARDGLVAVEGWVDTTALSALDLARQVEQMGARTLIYTDISRDGALTGPNWAAQEEMLRTVSCDVIASGGVAEPADLDRFRDLARLHPNLAGVIVGKALYEGKIDLARELAASRPGA